MRRLSRRLYTLSLTTGGAIILLSTLVVVWSVSAISPQSYLTSVSGTPGTLDPMFYDPRLSLTLAYPFHGPPGSATALPISYLADAVRQDFEETRGVRRCAAVQLTGESIAAACEVDEGMDMPEMAELLRRLADRQYYGIGLDLTLDDGLTRTNYLWNENLWSSKPLVSAPPNLLVLYDVWNELLSEIPGGHILWVNLSDELYQLGGWVAMGHSTSVSLRQFEYEADAQAAFEQEIGDHPIEDFHGYQAARWEEGGQNMPAGSLGRMMVWQAAQWVILIRSDDDTGYRTAFEPLDVAEMFYQRALELGLFSSETDEAAPTD